MPMLDTGDDWGVKSENCGLALELQRWIRSSELSQGKFLQWVDKIRDVNIY